MTEHQFRIRSFSGSRIRDFRRNWNGKNLSLFKNVFDRFSFLFVHLSCAAAVLFSIEYLKSIDLHHGLRTVESDCKNREATPKDAEAKSEIEKVEERGSDQHAFRFKRYKSKVSSRIKSQQKDDADGKAKSHLEKIKRIGRHQEINRRRYRSSGMILNQGKGEYIFDRQQR